MALGREHGHLVVAIDPPAEAPLRAAGCSLFLSTRTDEEGSVLRVSSASGTSSDDSSLICPASGVVGNVVMQMLLAAPCDAGETPFFMCNPCRVNCGTIYTTQLAGGTLWRAEGGVVGRRSMHTIVVA